MIKEIKKLKANQAHLNIMLRELLASRDRLINELRSINDLSESCGIIVHGYTSSIREAIAVNYKMSKSCESQIEYIENDLGEITCGIG